MDRRMLLFWLKLWCCAVVVVMFLVLGSKIRTKQYFISGLGGRSHPSCSSHQHVTAAGVRGLGLVLSPPY